MIIPKRFTGAENDIIHFTSFITQYLNDRGFRLVFLGYGISRLSENYCRIQYDSIFKTKERVEILNSLNKYFNWYFYEDSFIIVFNVLQARKNVRLIKLKNIF